MDGIIDKLLSTSVDVLWGALGACAVLIADHAVNKRRWKEFDEWKIGINGVISDLYKHANDNDRHQTTAERHALQGRMEEKLNSAEKMAAVEHLGLQEHFTQALAAHEALDNQHFDQLERTMGEVRADIKELLRRVSVVPEIRISDVG